MIARSELATTPSPSRSFFGLPHDPSSDARSALSMVPSPLRSAGQAGASQRNLVSTKSSTPASVVELLPMSLAMKRTRVVAVSGTKLPSE